MAFITDIKRFAVHDGDGIRTTVFFKGCPMKCIWCHNPETISPKKELALFSHKCTLCGRCVNVCPLHKIENGKHTVNRADCNFCGKCADVCHNGALEIVGKEMSTDQICEILFKDKAFYEESGGGITLSGGECLMQPEACAEILEKCKAESISTAVDTCGFVSKAALDAVIPFTDVFLYDIKAYDEEVHIKYTGKSNRLILDNLRYLDSLGKCIEIRIPCVPGCNAGQLDKIYGFLSEIKNIIRVRVLPYHNYAGSKYDALGMTNTMP